VLKAAGLAGSISLVGCGWAVAWIGLGNCSAGGSAGFLPGHTDGLRFAWNRSQFAAMGEYGPDRLATVFGEKLPVRIQKKMADFSRSSVPLPSAYLLSACFDFANVGIIKG
jgi:hypothetical protein